MIMGNLKTWLTKEGIELPIDQMSTNHLLSTIHMIERNRMTNLVHLGLADNCDQTILNYYSRWPDSYEELLNEAERRHLIGRRIRSKSEKLVKR